MVNNSNATELTETAGAEAKYPGAPSSFTRLFQASPAPFLVLAPDAPRFTITEVNDAYLTATMRTREEVIGHGIFDAYPDNPEDDTIMGVSRLRAALDHVLASGQPNQLPNLRYDVARPDGTFEERWWSPINSPVLDVNGEVEAIIHNAVDITEKRRAEAALRRGEALLSAVLDALPVGVILADAEGRVTRANAANRDLWGEPPEMTGFEQYDDWVGWWPATGERIQGKEWAMARALLHGEIVKNELIENQRFGTGERRFILNNAAPVRDASGTIVAGVVAQLDVTERFAAERALKLLNDTLEQRVTERTAERDRTWNNARDLLLVVDTKGVFRATNPAWMAILGWQTDELVGRSYLQFIHPDDHPSSEDALGTASHDALPTYVNRYRHKDGSYRWISWVAAPEADLIYASGRDITVERARDEELGAAQEALRQSQKMDAMGQLTGGVAHDFNNLLTPIVGALDMLQRKGLGGEREQRLINGAMQSAERARTLVQRLLAFARRQPLQATSVDVGNLVSGIVDLISSTIGPQIRVVVEIAGELPSALVDANQLEMALVNLGVNARDAMPDGGTLRISVDAVTVGRQHRANLSPGRYLQVSVADTGTGMDEETLKRSIEPFFSTKGVGKGTGLGLSMVHGLASQLGGAVTIRSASGIGTNVELWLPQSAEPHRETGPAEYVAMGTARGSTALLVDDEDLVRLSTADMLIDLGYAVVEAESAEEALKLVNRGLQPDVLITDHLMPGMSGTELARTLQKSRPGTKVLIVSGYAEADGVAPDLPRLTKPFRSVDLAESLAGLV